MLARVGERMTEKELLAMVAEASVCIFVFLAVQNSSIGDLVTDLLTHSLTNSGYFYF